MQTELISKITNEKKYQALLGHLPPTHSILQNSGKTLFLPVLFHVVTVVTNKLGLFIMKHFEFKTNLLPFVIVLMCIRPNVHKVLS